MFPALCLSGGGANAAFHIGALKHLHHIGTKYSVISGVSSGALNGSLIAQGKEKRLFEIWEKVTEEEIFKRPRILGSEKLGILWRIFVKGEKSIYDAQPLLNFIRREVILADIKIPLYIGLVSLFTGQYVSLKNSDFYEDEGLQDAIAASSLMPVMWNPVQVLTTNALYTQCCDGGVKNVTPLADLINEELDRIIIISTHSGKIEKKLSRNIIDIAKRVFMELMLGEIIKNDVEELLVINDLVKQAQEGGVTLKHPKSGRPYKYFETIIISPPENLGNPLDFSREHLDRCMNLGQAAAIKALDNLKGNI